ncbi:hypothetical protein DYB32_003265 [Aphanomyces invadans]|nr:hypothetical protein DYB32_003265 [Aphanomyces invadans]
MFGMTHLFLERVKEFLHVERKEFSELQDGEVLQLLDNIIQGNPSKSAQAPESPVPSSAASTTTSSIDGDDASRHLAASDHTPHCFVSTIDLHSEIKVESDGTPAHDDDDDVLLEFDVDELEDLLAVHNL